MATQSMNPTNNTVLRSENVSSWLKKYMLMRFHPRSLLFDSIGLMWFVYYFWYHDWQKAFIIAVIARMLAIASVRDIDTEQFANTTLGKLALLHLQPLNLTIQVLGSFALLYGLWMHSAEFILASLTVILLGHMFGWPKVDDRLSNKKI